MTTLQQKNTRRKKNKSSANKLATKLRDRALQAGATKLLVFASLLSLALGALIYYQYITPQAAANDALREALANKRKQNAIARMVQETKPQFLDQFRFGSGESLQSSRHAPECCPIRCPPQLNRH